MTRAFHHNLKCPKCGTAVERSTTFSLWLRDLPYPYTSQNFSNQNLDYIWHNYREHWFITIEEKTRGGSDPDNPSAMAQRDTHGIVEQMLKHADGSKVQTLFRGQRAMRYRGHYLVVFQNTSPDDSAWVTINDLFVTRSEFMDWLRRGVLGHVPKERGPIDFNTADVEAA